MVLDQIKSKMESQIKKWRNGSSTSREQSRINPEEISLKGTSASLNLSADEGNNFKIFKFKVDGLGPNWTIRGG